MSVQAQVVDLLRDLQRRYNLAYLFISHDLKVVRALANDIVVMRDGKVVEKGTAEQIFDSPKSDYTKALMAAAFEIAPAPEGVVHQNAGENPRGNRPSSSPRGLGLRKNGLRRRGRAIPAGRYSSGPICPSRRRSPTPSPGGRRKAL
jgi:ABC-type proline/glycine betaine transport system ATPase subunit